MDIKEIRRLVALMNANDLVEIEIEVEGSKVKLKKRGDAMVNTVAAYAPAMPAAAPAPAAPGAAASPAAAPESTPTVEGDSVTFNSPMVGTFYTAASPGTEPFVKVGARVGQKSVLCIIEAMKVMNEITADMEGEVLELLVGDGEAVEFNQPLFTIRPK